ncbi:MAG: HGGxSTG domain-containing protein [Rhodomicrobium sp.]
MNREHRNQRDKRARELLFSGAVKKWPDAQAAAHVESLCGARTKRDGSPCRARKLPGKKRCKFHGGPSCGPRSLEYREYLRQRMIAMNKTEEARARSRRIIYAVHERRWGFKIETENA